VTKFEPLPSGWKLQIISFIYRENMTNTKSFGQVKLRISIIQE